MNALSIGASFGAIVCLAASGYSALRVERPDGAGDVNVHVDITLLGLVLLVVGVALLVAAFKLRAKSASTDGA